MSQWFLRRETRWKEACKSDGVLNIRLPTEQISLDQAENLRRYFVYVSQGARNAWVYAAWKSGKWNESLNYEIGIVVEEVNGDLVTFLPRCFLLSSRGPPGDVSHRFCTVSLNRCPPGIPVKYAAGLPCQERTCASCRRRK